MPTYEYECESCGCKFEEFQGINEQPLKICPCCKKGTVKKLISGGGGLLFRGNGFYVTDYKGHGKDNGTGRKSKSVKANNEHKVSSVDKKTNDK